MHYLLPPSSTTIRTVCRWRGDLLSTSFVSYCVDILYFPTFCSILRSVLRESTSKTPFAKVLHSYLLPEPRDTSPIPSTVFVSLPCSLPWRHPSLWRRIGRVNGGPQRSSTVSYCVCGVATCPWRDVGDLRSAGLYGI